MTGRWGSGSRQERLDAAQWEGVNLWRINGANGTLEWHTGVGKTYSVVKLYKPFRTKFSADEDGNNIIVVVPTTKLKEDWEGHSVIKDGKEVWVPGHIEKHGFENIEVFVINTYVTTHHHCKLLIIDEVHRVLGSDAETFNKTIDVTEADFKLGLSATLTWEEKETLINKGMPIVHTITELEAREEEFTSDYIEFNLAVPLDRIEEKEYRDASEMFERNKRYFVVSDQFDLKIAFAASQNDDICRKIAILRQWNGTEDSDDSPKKIKGYAGMCIKGMGRRKEILYNSISKLNTTVQLINMFPDKRIMTFSMSSDMADNITTKVGKRARSYHTKIKGEIREMPADLFGKPTKAKKMGVANLKKETLTFFAEKKITVLNTVKALDEGYDLPDIDMSIITCGASKERQQKQRKGRSTRYDKNNIAKKSIIINLYSPNTQDENWLKERQKTAKGVKWIKTFDEIANELAKSEDFDIGS